MSVEIHKSISTRIICISQVISFLACLSMSTHASTCSTASSAGTGKFQHEGLPDPRNHLRLLEITSVDETREVHVHCKLTTWPVTRAPVYNAISYTWGDPHQLASVLVNGMVMEVRRNCEYVLKQAWRQGGSSYVWIDAICINQTDNDEKNSQVAMMSGVYQRAGRVLACVGQHGDDSEFLFKRLRRHKWWWGRFRSMHLDAPRALYSAYQLLVRATCRVLMRKSSLVRLFRAVINFLKRPYFQRVWIYQELFYGRHIQLCCDDETIPLMLLWGLYVVMIACPAWDGSRFRLTSEVDFVLEAGAVVGTGKVELHSALLSQVTALKSEDRRDKLFGILSIIDWGEMKPIQPDYSKDRFDLAVEALVHMRNDRRLGWIIHNVLFLDRILEFIEIPTASLATALEERRSSSLNTRSASPATAVEKLTMPTMFWGQRLCFEDARWKIQPPHAKDGADRSGSSLQEPTVLSGDDSLPMIQKWSGDNSWLPLDVDILLPQEAQPGDWLLIQESYPIHSPGLELPHVLFLARENGGHRLQLVGKALIHQFNHWQATCRAAWRDRVDHFVYIDPEDAVVLALSLCPASNKYPRERLDPLGPEWRKRQAEGARRYFETRLCGDRSASYATPIRS